MQRSKSSIKRKELLKIYKKIENIYSNYHNLCFGSFHKLIIPKITEADFVEMRENTLTDAKKNFERKKCYQVQNLDYYLK